MAKAKNRSPRPRVIFESSCRRLPAAALRGLARGLALRVERREARRGEVDLAPHLEQRGPALPGEPERHIGDGAEVGGDLLAHDAVAARRAHGEHAVAVREADRRAVDLDLHRVAGATDIRRDARVAVLPRLQLFIAEGVGEGEHRRDVAVLGELRGGLGADPQGGRVARPQVGVGGLEGLKLVEQAVVLGVGHLRRVEHVVGVDRAVQDAAEFRGPRERVGHLSLGLLGDDC
jgi:hypothetical protein